MDIISINVAANKALLKMKNEGIEALTLVGADGKKYEVTVNAGGVLAVTIKPEGGGESDSKVVTFGNIMDYSESRNVNGGTYYKVSDRVLTQAELENSTFYVEYRPMHGGTNVDWNPNFFSVTSDANGVFANGKDMISNPIGVVYVPADGSGTYINYRNIMDWTIFGPDECKDSTDIICGEIRLA